jgi:hypothetical protein
MNASACLSLNTLVDGICKPSRDEIIERYKKAFGSSPF